VKTSWTLGSTDRAYRNRRPVGNFGQLCHMSPRLSRHAGAKKPQEIRGDGRGRVSPVTPIMPELARLNGDDTARQRELREAHRLFLEIGAPIRAEQVAKELAG
jgi:hypothetical protein